MDAEEAGRAAQDIVSGDELLRTNPAPQPDENVVAGIKTFVSAALAERRHRIALHHRILSAAAVAAAVVVVSAAALKFYESQPAERTTMRMAAAIPDRIWESSDIAADDADIAVLAAEISTIENELYGVELTDNGTNGSASADDLEMELIGVSGDFWKG
jgi:hypothetical protein